MSDEEHETKSLSLLVNLVALCLLLPASAHLSYFGVANLFRFERDRQQTDRRVNDRDDERKCLGWPYLKLLAISALTMAFCYVASLWYYICVTPAWMRGYRKDSAANVFCRVDFDLFMFFGINSYFFFISFWLERLLFTFQGVISHAQISTRCKWMLRVPLFMSWALSFLYLGVDFIFKGSIVDLKSADLNPFKGVNEHPTICQSLLYDGIIFDALIIYGGVVIVSENAYLGYAYFTRLKAIFSMTRRRMSNEEEFMRKVAVVALLSVCSTMFCFVAELLVGPFAFFIALDVAFNSLCVVASFAFGNEYYQLLFSHFEPMCLFVTAMNFESSVLSMPTVVSHNELELETVADTEDCEDI